MEAIDRWLLVVNIEIIPRFVAAFVTIARD